VTAAPPRPTVPAPGYVLGSMPGRLPLVGHAPRLLSDPCGFLASLPAHGDLVRIGLGPHTATVVCHPELTRQILADDRTFDKGGPLVDRGRELFGDSLAICGHDKHRRQRRLIQPAFQAARLPAFSAVITEEIGKLVGSWRDGAVIDVRAEMRGFTSQVAVTAMFAAAMSQAERRQALDDLSTLLSGTYRRMFMPAFLARLPLAGNRRYETVRTRLRSRLGRLMADYRAAGIDHGDVLSKLLSYTEDGTPRLTDDEIVDQILILFTGGSDTTANALSWAAYLVARHQDVETRLHAEADAVLAGRVAAGEDLENLPYTRQVVTEVLRLYPPVSMVTRTVTADTELGGHRLRAGSVVVFSPGSVHRHPALFPEPGRFDPGRWAGQQPPLPRGAFVPFGDGPRKCIGDTIGMTMATLALASIAARWRLVIPAGADVRPVLRTFLAPRGVRATLRERSA
jgi:cytochrome P450